jgi:hypothetical protein
MQADHMQIDEWVFLAFLKQAKNQLICDVEKWVLLSIMHYSNMQYFSHFRICEDWDSMWISWHFFSIKKKKKKIKENFIGTYHYWSFITFIIIHFNLKSHYFSIFCNVNPLACSNLTEKSKFPKYFHFFKKKRRKKKKLEQIWPMHRPTVVTKTHRWVRFVTCGGSDFIFFKKIIIIIFNN